MLNLETTTVARLSAENEELGTEYFLEKNINSFIETNQCFSCHQIVVFIYDVTHQASLLLIKSLMISAKRNNALLTFFMALKTYMPNLPVINSRFNQENHVSSRLGERYADFHQKFYDYAIKMQANEESINDGEAGVKGLNSDVKKAKCIIDALACLNRNTRLTAADTADFIRCFKEYTSRVS